MIAVLLPTVLLVGVGWALGRLGHVPSRPFAQAAFWVFSPSLIFESLRTAELSAAGTVVLFAVLHLLILFILSLVVGRLLFRRDAPARAATSLVLTFGNCGNLGLPILLFAYGPSAVDVGVVFLAAQTVLLATLGVALAAWDGGRVRWWSMLGSLLRGPWPYAVGAALLARGTGLPEALSRATELLASGAIPLFLLLLGLELARVRMEQLAGPAIGLAVFRLVAGGLLAWALAWGFRAEGLLRGSLVIEGSTPSAVNAFLLASQYNRRPDLAASALFLSTLLSLGTLSVTLVLLGAAG